MISRILISERRAIIPVRFKPVAIRLTIWKTREETPQLMPIKGRWEYAHFTSPIPNIGQPFISFHSTELNVSYPSNVVSSHAVTLIPELTERLLKSLLKEARVLFKLAH